MYIHHLQSNRFELKYLVSEAAARAAKQFCAGHLVPDEYARPQLGNAYPIHSLYLDSADRTLCQASMTGLKNRFKLRIRFYDDLDDSPVFFEIKRRINDVIKKERALVRRESVPGLLNHRRPERNDLWSEFDTDSLAVLGRFCQLRDILRADGCVFVSYLREAYVSPNDDQVRVTFDRQIQAGMYGRSLGIQQIDARCQPQIRGVVLELKFCDRFPLWMQEMARELNLQRTAMAKYVHCVESLNSYLPRMIAAGMARVLP